MTRFAALGENASHDQHVGTLDRLPSGPPLHLVQGPDEEASGRREAIRPLHLSQVRLPAHHPPRAEARARQTLVRSVKRLAKLIAGKAASRANESIPLTNWQMAKPNPHDSGARSDRLQTKAAGETKPQAYPPPPPPGTSRISATRERCVRPISSGVRLVVFFSEDRTQTLSLNQGRHLFDHVPIPAEVDSKVPDRGNPFLNEGGHTASGTGPGWPRLREGRDAGKRGIAGSPLGQLILVSSCTSTAASSTPPTTW